MRVNEVYAYQVMPAILASQACILSKTRKPKKEPARVEPVIQIHYEGLEYQVGRFLDIKI
ncbi:MAG: hypothetical protein AABW91_00170 [Nanoarchaeota archaeon]